MAQSVVSLSIALALLLAGEHRSTRVRRGAGVALLCALAVAMVALPFSADRFDGMGDYRTYTRTRESFLEYVFPNPIRFSSHLGFVSLYLIDRLLGADQASFPESFRVLSSAAGIAVLAGVIALGWLEGWSARWTRFAALAVAAPATVMGFGYRDLGFLALSAIAFPVLERGLRRRDLEVEAAAALLGLGFAFHGFGLLGFAGGCAAIAIERATRGERMRLLLAFTCTFLAAGASWLLLYLAVFHLKIVPFHAADGLLFRRLLEPYPALGRIVSPLVSWDAVRDTLWALAVQGAPLVLLAAALASTARSCDRRRVLQALAFSIPGACFTIAFFFPQGLAIDIDLVIAAFPGIYALAWAIAASRRHSWLALPVLVAGHAAFWWVFANRAFIHQAVN